MSEETFVARVLALLVDISGHMAVFAAGGVVGFIVRGIL